MSSWEILTIYSTSSTYKNDWKKEQPFHFKNPIPLTKTVYKWTKPKSLPWWCLQKVQLVSVRKEVGDNFRFASMGKGQGAFSLLAVIHIDNVKVAAAVWRWPKRNNFFGIKRWQWVWVRVRVRERGECGENWEVEKEA